LFHWWLDDAACDYSDACTAGAYTTATNTADCTGCYKTGHAVEAAAGRSSTTVN